MIKTKIFSDKLLLTIALVALAAFLSYLILAVTHQHQPLVLPWNEIASVGWVSKVISL
jgi:hypothetical protein